MVYGQSDRGDRRDGRRDDERRASHRHDANTEDRRGYFRADQGRGSYNGSNYRSGRPAQRSRDRGDNRRAARHPSSSCSSSEDKRAAKTAKRIAKRKERLLDLSPGYRKHKAREAAEAIGAKAHADADIMARALMMHGFGLGGAPSPGPPTPSIPPGYLFPPPPAGAPKGPAHGHHPVLPTTDGGVPTTDGEVAGLSEAHLTILESLFPTSVLSSNMNLEQFVQAAKPACKGTVSKAVATFLEKRALECPRGVPARLGAFFTAVTAMK
jgi:hypothetical protein